MPSAPIRMEAAKDMVLKDHPSARVRSLASVYNCIGMVFASRRTWVGPETMPMILGDDEYRPLPNDDDLTAGDVVVYRDEEGAVAHVGLVTEVKTNIEKAQWEVFVLSQWGRDGEYFHRLDDVNLLLGKPTEYWTDRI